MNSKGVQAQAWTQRGEGGGGGFEKPEVRGPIFLNCSPNWGHFPKKEKNPYSGVPGPVFSLSFCDFLLFSEFSGELKKTTGQSMNHHETYVIILKIHEQIWKDN